LLWGLQVIGCIVGSYFWIEHVRNDYLTELLRALARQLREARHNLDPNLNVSTELPDLWSYLLNASLGVLVIVMVLFGIPALIRRVITGRWRFGPRW
jgi:hypothetical protein